MFLKKIEIQGFKSFADKTVIEFKGGITGVVGPNGSGKSNISDSIRWVLGEQSVKTLRGSKMEDVVFAGTESRKPLGFAEVTLVLDNSQRDLPIEYSEVSVTRRVFRSGESEYYINKSACRLKDIRELFMDTGVGKDGYSIIGQGKIDEILSSKSEDRRNIFEEAAGIVKYKSRKEEAEKKLKKTEDNLLRINDIVAELEKQLLPLEAQSKKALEYTDLSTELKNLEINHYIREIEQVKDELSELEEDSKVKNIELESEVKERVSIEDSYTKIKETIEQLDHSIETIKNNRFTLKSEIDNIQNQMQIIREKLNFFQREIERFKKEEVSLRETIEKIEQEENKKFKSKDILDRDLEIHLEKLKNKEQQLNSLNTAIDTKEHEIEDKKSSILEVFNLMAEKKNKINSLSSFNQNIDRRLVQLDEELTQLENLKSDLVKVKTELESDIDKFNLDLEEKAQNLEEVLNLRRSVSVEIESVTDKINNTEREIHSKTSKHRVLNDMSREYEGYYKGVKNALKACDGNSKLNRGVRGVLAELISVPKRYEKAIEVALGATIQNIVTDSQEDARDIINYLKKNNLGRATFLPIDSIKKRELNINEKKLLKQSGVCGVASELIEYKDDFISVLEYLLGRVIIVEKIEDGMEISKKSNFSLKVVSLEGDVLNPGGSMTGGSLQNTNTKLLGRQREIEELSEEINALKDIHHSLIKKREEWEKKLGLIEEDQVDYTDSINKIRFSIANLENKSIQNLAELEKNKASIGKYSKERDNLIHEKENIVSDMTALEVELEKLKTDNKNTEEIIEKEMIEFSEEKRKKDILVKDITELRISNASLREQQRNLKDTLVRLNEEKNAATYEIDKRKVEEDGVRCDIVSFNKKTEELLISEKQLIEKLDEKESMLDIKSIERQELLKLFKQQEEKLKTLDNEISSLEKCVNLFELKIEKTNLRYENFHNKLWDDYELTFVMAKKHKEDIADFEYSKDQIKEIKSKIKSMGVINLNAIEEYKEVSERFEFMTLQIKDLNMAKDSLDDVIKDMNEKMREQFLENFKIIKTNFIEVFEKLFGGGHADVFLEDSQDILTSGIEIVAQPPGKKLQSLSLLSGGERALTAIALLFAIIKTKPTPFCILDEIEAALDEANVYRYAQYLRGFSHSTQFIAITHRKGTMENVDSLYGVTMEEQGISKLVSIKLSQKERVS